MIRRLFFLSEIRVQGIWAGNGVASEKVSLLNLEIDLKG